MQVEELKTNFVSMMSHDLKTPLARIQGMTDVIARDDNPLSPLQADALMSIQKSGEELANFITSILNLGRIESQEIKLQLVTRDINALLEDVIHRHDFLAREKHITVVKELEPLFSVRMDVELMRQVFSNLLENAIKYSREGGRVLISSEEANGRIVVQIADQGTGIAAEELPNIFMKFYRSKDARISTIRGSGLGLYLAKYFVELHNGVISVDSTVGAGTSFTVDLPMNTP
jgi:signal transduction histidine kinase